VGDSEEVAEIAESALEKTESVLLDVLPAVVALSLTIQGIEYLTKED
jgi:hypothetical protein